MRDHVLLFINGQTHHVHGADVFLSLADFLRWRLRLVGTKIVCSEGDCGSCSVLIGRKNDGRMDDGPMRDGQWSYRTVDSCIQFVFQLDGCHVVTIEGLKVNGSLNAAQEAMIACHGSQCGFCTPGFVVAMTGLAQSDEPISEATLREGLAGNLCRCTGYSPILAAGMQLNGRSQVSLNDLYPPMQFAAQIEQSVRARILVRTNKNGCERVLCSPTDLAGAIEFLKKQPDAKIVAGATDVGVQVNKGMIRPDYVLDLNRVVELASVQIVDGTLVAGSRATWTDIRSAVERVSPELRQVLDVFGSLQIRNVGTIGGNIANASPIADSLPFLYVCEAILEIAGPEGERTVNINDFYHGYKQIDLSAGELITAIRVPLPQPDQVLRLYRVSKRRDMDIASFTAAILVQLEGDIAGTQVIKEASIAFGAVGPTVLRARKTEAFLIGKTLSESTMAAAGEIAVTEISPISDVRGSAEYRSQLTRNVLIKFWHDVGGKSAESSVRVAREVETTSVDFEVPANGRTGTSARVAREVETTSVDFEVPANGRIGTGDPDACLAPSVGQTIPHESAVGHVSGESPYLDDLPLVENELFVSFVGSPVACGVVQNIDISEAKTIDGLVGIFTASDIPGQNAFGPIVQDDWFLADRIVQYVGQPVVVVAAETLDALERARQAVRIDVVADDPVLTIDEAIAQRAFLGPEARIGRGDVKGAMRSAPHVLRGTLYTGGQEQFYLESQAAIAYPGEEDQITVHSSTQNPTEIQTVVAEMLGLGCHQVVCLCKRMGGAFGGKETQASIPALMAALVAARTNRPARVIYNKDDDMKITGKRHAYRTDWQVGFDDDGQILALDVHYYSDGGASTDLSPAVLQRTMLHAENAYFIPNINIRGQVCFTNKPPNTAFRGFGGPQAILVIENLLESIAEHRSLDAFDVRRRNVYGTSSRNVTPYGQVFDRNNLPAIFDSLVETSGYRERLERVKTNNSESKSELRGISLTAVKFGIAFTNQSLNQASALVNVYTDGTVQVSTGGTEMGQGLHTKIRQIVADEFSIRPDRVMVMPSSTEKNNNASATAASAGTDLNGLAAVDACRQVKVNLAKCVAKWVAEKEEGNRASVEQIVFDGGAIYDSRSPERRLSFGEAALMAHRSRASIGARGFYATPGLDFDRETGQGSPFFYFTQGAAVAEVLIDRFTGNLKVLRTDLLIDIGKSINPGVDMGQVTGAFIQGLGWVTTEELCYGDGGELVSYSPTTYKIPAITDVPEQFHCAFFDTDDNVLNIRRSKAVGEPPLMLGISVWTAVKHALTFYSIQAANDLRVPATGEEILRCISRSGLPSAT